MDHNLPGTIDVPLVDVEGNPRTTLEIQKHQHDAEIRKVRVPTMYGRKCILYLLLDLVHTNDMEGA